MELRRKYPPELNLDDPVEYLTPPDQVRWALWSLSPLCSVQGRRWDPSLQGLAVCTCERGHRSAGVFSACRKRPPSD